MGQSSSTAAANHRRSLQWTDGNRRAEGLLPLRGPVLRLKVFTS
jgi:hypothetical protein